MGQILGIQSIFDRICVLDKTLNEYFAKASCITSIVTTSYHNQYNKELALNKRIKEKNANLKDILGKMEEEYINIEII
jgi:hypothetical protein